MAARWKRGMPGLTGGRVPRAGSSCPGRSRRVSRSSSASAPRVEFEDCSQIMSVDLRQCLLATGAATTTWSVVEWDPADDRGVAQIKYYANGDVIKVSSSKILRAKSFEQALARDLMPDELVWARALARHLYRTAHVKLQAVFADAPPLVQDPPPLPPPPPAMP